MLLALLGGGGAAYLRPGVPPAGATIRLAGQFWPKVIGVGRSKPHHAVDNAVSAVFSGGSGRCYSFWL